MTAARPFRFCGLFVVLTLALGLALASASAKQIVAPSGPPIRLNVGKGTLIELAHNASTVFVADPDIADVRVKSPRLIYLYAKSPGETSLYAVDAEQHVMVNQTVLVQRDIGRLQTALNKLITDGVVHVRAIDDSLVLSGRVNSSVDAEEAKRLARSFVANDRELIDRIKVDAPNQVNLRVRVAEVQHNVIKELGINWDALTYPGAFAFGLATGLPTNGTVTSTGQRVVRLAPNLASAITGASPLSGFFTRNAGVGGVTTDSGILGLNTGRVSINNIIDALNQHGLVHILAEPNLTAMSGQTASFLAGGEFPILVPQGNNEVTVQFKKFGVSLAFTPVVLGNGRISLRVRPEVSQISETGAVQIRGFTIPALTTRRAETTVELGSGQTFAIGGLLQNNITNTIKKVPGLGDLPVLGPMFRSTQFQHDQTELVILVTPYLVRPVSQPRLAAPTDGYVPPNDNELFVDGRTSGPPAAPGAPSTTGPNGRAIIGPAGFILH